MLCWAEDAQPTGADDSIAIIQNISQVTRSVWQTLDSFLQEYQKHRTAEDFEEWEEKRKELYAQFAPLLDRVGRLTTDASMILQYEAGASPMQKPDRTFHRGE